MIEKTHSFKHSIAILKVKIKKNKMMSRFIQKIVLNTSLRSNSIE